MIGDLAPFHSVQYSISNSQNSLANLENSDSDPRGTSYFQLAPNKAMRVREGSCS